MTAILFGSIGTLADTSELQREAFNAAFAAHGLDWNWTQAEYQRLLTGSGGENRITDYAGQRGETVDAAAVHETKSEKFRQALAGAGVVPRDDVAAVVDEAREAGVKVGLITTTSAENVDALARALAPDVDVKSFDLILDVSSVEAPKPDPEVYRLALEKLGESAETVVAIEDNVGGVEAATAAGLTCLALPGENNAGHDFGAAKVRLDRLTPADVTILHVAG